MLTGLQERVARIVARLAEADGFALAGGAAVIIHGVVDRATDDLDYFGATVEDVGLLAQALRAALLAERLEVETITETPGFIRLHIRSTAEETTIDLGTDARLLPTDSTILGETLSIEELAADKLLALFSRAQARDFVDVAALTGRVGGLERICELAAAKDAGFSRTVLAEMLGAFTRLPQQEFGLDEAAYLDLAGAVARWRQALGARR